MLAKSLMTPTEHLMALVGFAVVVFVLIVAGRRNDAVTRRVFGTVAAAAWLTSSVFYVLPENLEPHMSLPIQACDLLALFAVIALWLPSRLMRAVMYFGGFGLTTQAFLTPVPEIGGPDNIRYWIFWSVHGVIVATSIYVLVVERFRPAFRDLCYAVAFWAVYAVAMIGLDYGTYAGGLNDGEGWYYGYLGPTLPKAVQGSVLKYLGDWPLRPLLMMALALAIFVMLWLPWWVVAKLREQPK